MRSLKEIKTVLTEYTLGPVIPACGKDAFNWALGYRDLAIRLYMEKTGARRDVAAIWCADEALNAVQECKKKP